MQTEITQLKDQIKNKNKTKNEKNILKFVADENKIKEKNIGLNYVMPKKTLKNKEVKKWLNKKIMKRLIVIKFFMW